MTHKAVSGGELLPPEGSGEVQGRARGKHPLLSQHVVQPVSAGHTLALRVGLVGGGGGGVRQLQCHQTGFTLHCVVVASVSMLQ